MDWLTDCLGIKVEKVEIPRPGGAAYYPVGATGKGVLHTTEGSSVAGAIGTFRARGFAPHFITGEGRIVQCRPLWAQASTLHTGFAPNFCNQIAQVQIEQVGSSRSTLYDLPDSTRIPSLHLLAYFAESIPLIVPPGTPAWGDDLADCSKPLAADNSRRRSERFYGPSKGWYMHMEVPDQGPTWHWDCGAIRRTAMLKDAAALIPPPPGKEGLLAALTDEEQAEALYHLREYACEKAGRLVRLGINKHPTVTLSDSSSLVIPDDPALADFKGDRGLYNAFLVGLRDV